MSWKKYIGLGVSGIEWYDTAMCSALAQIISELFFPEFNKATRFIFYFSTFAIGYLGRPLGAFLFGTYSDRVCRIRAVYVAFSIMIFSTLTISLLPTYSIIGILAPLAFVFLRFIQGIAIGGNYGVSVFSIENANKCEKYFTSSLINIGIMVGFFVGGLVSSGINFFMSREFLLEIGWRIPLWSSFSLGFPVFLGLRKFSKECISQRKNQENPAKMAASSKITFKMLAMIATMLLLDMVPFYMFFIFLPNCRIQFMDQLPWSVWLNQSVGIFVIIVLIPFFGKFADAYGPVRSLKFSALSLIAISFFAPWNHWIWSPIFGAIMAACYGSLYGIVALIFPKNIRARAGSLTLNTTGAIFGGLTPLIATFLYKINENLLGVFLALVGIAVLFAIQKLKKYENEF